MYTKRGYVLSTPRTPFFIALLAGLSLCFSAVLSPADSITFEAALNQALKSNSSIKQSMSDLKKSQALVEKTYGMFDLQLDGNLTYSATKTEAASVLAPEETEVLAYKFSLSEKIFTGGRLSLDYNSSWTNLLYPESGADPGLPGMDLSMFTAGVNPAYQPAWSLGFSQPLLKDLLGRPDQVAIQIGKCTIRLSREQLKNTILEQVSGLREAYFSVILAGTVLNIQKENLKDSEAFYRQTLKLKQIGMREEKDVLQTKASLLNARAEIAPAKNQVKAAQENFFQLAGFPAAQWETLTLNIEKSVPAIEFPRELTPKLETRLIKSQPAVISSQLGREIAKLSKRIADNAAWPALNLFGNYGLSGLDESFSSSHEKLFSNNYPAFAVGLNFTMYLPDRNRSGDITIKNEDLAKAEEQLAFLEKTTRIRIRHAQRSLLSAQQNYELKKSSCELLEQYLKIQNKHFFQGRISTRELLMAHGDYHGAQFKESHAFFEYLKAVNTWNNLTGQYDQYYTSLAKE